MKNTNMGDRNKGAEKPYRIMSFSVDKEVAEWLSDLPPFFRSKIVSAWLLNLKNIEPERIEILAVQNDLHKLAAELLKEFSISNKNTPEQDKDKMT